MKVSDALANISSLYEGDSSSEEDNGEIHILTSDKEENKRKMPDSCNPSKRICQKAEDEKQPNASDISINTSPMSTSKETRLLLPTELMEMFKEKEISEAEVVKIDSSKFCDDLDQLLTLFPELNRAKDFHISLSKTIVLRHHWIQPFVQSLKIRLQYIKRTFLGIQVDRGDSQLRELVEKIDECLKEFKLTTFYEDPSFHVSIGWCIGDRQQELTKTLPALQKKWSEYESGQSPTKICNITCKTGNKIFQFPLAN